MILILLHSSTLPHLLPTSLDLTCCCCATPIDRRWRGNYYFNCTDLHQRSVRLGRVRSLCICMYIRMHVILMFFGWERKWSSSVMVDDSVSEVMVNLSPLYVRWPSTVNLCYVSVSSFQLFINKVIGVLMISMPIPLYIHIYSLFY